MSIPAYGFITNKTVVKLKLYSLKMVTGKNNQNVRVYFKRALQKID